MKLALIFIINLLLIHPSNAQVDNFYYDEGIKERDQGNYEAAAAIWSQGDKVLSARNIYDPRMGIAFMEMAAELNQKEYFEEASRVYINGFSNANVSGFEEIIIAQAEMIEPLLIEEDKSIWKELISNKDSTLAWEVARFWIERDPVPTTVTNERLVEHWQRIYYARKNFTENRNSVYGTDDRGLIYVRYGNPDKLGQKTLGSPQDMDPYVNRSAVRNYLWYDTEIHIWVYTNLVPSESLIFIFGKTNDRSFGLRTGLDEFIPREAFRRNNFGRLPPGGELQLLIYSQWKDFDKFFRRRYQEILYHRGTDPANMRLLADRYTMQDRSDFNKIYGPQELSEYEKLIKPIDIVYTQIRTLDDDNKPKIGIVAFSFIKGEFENTPIEEAFGDGEAREYSLIHKLIVRDRLFNEVNRTIYSPSKLFDNTASFVLDHDESSRFFTLSAEMFNTNRNNYIEESIDQGYQPYLGEVFLDGLEPLNTDIGELELSDLITGYEVPDKLKQDDFPFPVIPGEKIPAGANLQVYFEIYHLFVGADDKAQYTMEFKVSKASRRGLIARLRGQSKEEEVLSQSTTLESLDNTVKDVIAFDVSELKEGKYSFEVIITDILSGKTKSREGNFEITDK